MDSQQYAVIGGDSVIGAELVRSLRADGHRVLSTTRRHENIDHSWQLPGDHCVYFDLRMGIPDYEWASESVASLYKPSVAFICAAVTGESCTAESRAVNVDATLALAKMFRDIGTHVVFPSTTRPPVEEYAKQKRDVEKVLLDSGGASIVRLGKVLTPGFPLFAKWATALRKGEPIECRADLSLSPISLPLAASALRATGESMALAPITVASMPSLTYYEIGCVLARQIGRSTDFVKPIRSSNTMIGDCYYCDCDSLGIDPPSPWFAVDEAFSITPQLLKESIR